MSRKNALWRLFAAFVVVVVALWGYILLQSYEGRVRLVDSQRVGCERGKLDRAANAAAWWIAERARIDTANDPQQEPHARETARIAAEQYGAIAAQLEARSLIDCHAAYPNASLSPL